MDTLSEVLDNIRASGALLDRSLIPSPWTIDVEAAGSITIVTMLAGGGWLQADGGDPARIGLRDLVILTGPGVVRLCSDRDVKQGGTRFRITGGRCEGEAGAVLPPAAVGICGPHGRGGLGRGDSGEGDVVLTGSIPTAGRIAERLLRALPSAVVVPREQQRSHALDLLEAELSSTEPGQQAVLDRLLDLVLIGALRDWFALPEVTAPAWYGAAGDPVVGPALTALHSDPARGWTVESLAREAQVSRAAFARQFHELMGEPPISYLAGWRLCLAADLLQEGDDTLESIARQVGYSSAYALSAAFTREYGVRPSRYRVLARGEGQGLDAGG